MSSPLVSVILPVYNAEKYIGNAINSILNQSYTNFELLIIEDGSSDQSLQCIRSFNDKRIRLIENGKNIGLVGSLNKGIEYSKGSYIARMDADDESMSERIKKQVEYLESHPVVGVLGTATITFNKSKSKVLRYLPNHDGLLTLLFFNSCMSHPSVMMRKSVLVQNNILYDNTYKNAEDYDLWTRLARVTKLANLQEPLLKYRVHDNQLTQAQKTGVNNSAEVIRRRQLKLLAIEPTSDEIELHNIIGNSGTVKSIEELLKMETWLIKLVGVNTKHKVVSPEIFNAYLIDIWFDLCAKAGLGKRGFRIATRSELTKGVGSFSLKTIRLFVKIFILNK